MSNTNTQTVNTADQAQPQSLGPVDFERLLVRSEAFAWLTAAGLPCLGALAGLSVGLPAFACLMSGCFLLATALVCHKAVAAFTGRALRLLVTARLVVVLVLGSLLFCASGSAWAAVVSAALLWLTADRLLGRRALCDLWKLTRRGP